MAKILFIPVSIVTGLVAGFLGKKLFDGLWGVIDDEEPPDSKYRDISWGKLLLAGAIQGAIFRAVKEATDHAVAARLLPDHRYLAGRDAPRSRVAAPVLRHSPRQKGHSSGRKNRRIRAFTDVRVQG